MFQDFKCKPGYVCELQMINCLTKKPCYPEPVCVIGPGRPTLRWLYISLVLFCFLTSCNILQ